MKVSLFQGVLIGIFIFATMVGLYVFSTHTSNNSSAKDAIGTVVIWGTLPKADMQNALTAITQAEPTLKGVSYVQKDEATLSVELSSAIATGNAPDLVLASQEDLLSLKKFITLVPSATLPASTFTTTFIGEGNLFAAPDGTGYYGIPFLVDPLVLYSNRSILSSDGVAVPPATWEALAGLVPNVAQLTPTRQVTRSLIALGTYANVHNARAILSTLFLQTNVPVSSYANGALVGNLSGTSGTSGTNGTDGTTANTTSPGQAVLGFYTQFADPSKVSYTWNASLADSRQMFLTGNLALYLGFSSEAKFLSTANPNLDYLVTPIPQPATASVKSTYGLVYALMVPTNAKNASGAYRTASLLTNAPEQAISTTATRLAPATLSQLGAVPADPTAAVAYAEALYAKGWLSPAPADTDKVFSNIITSVITGSSNLSMTLTSGESALTSLLQK